MNCEEKPTSQAYSTLVVVDPINASQSSVIFKNKLRSKFLSSTGRGFN